MTWGFITISIETQYLKESTVVMNLLTEIEDLFAPEKAASDPMLLEVSASTSGIPSLYVFSGTECSSYRN